MPRHSKKQYNRVAESDEDNDDDDVELSNSATTSITSESGSSSDSMSPTKTLDDDMTPLTSKAAAAATEQQTTMVVDPDAIPLIILDPAQTKFRVMINPSTQTVADLKVEGHKIHKIAPPQQRLIWRGRMLDDSCNLKEIGLSASNTIVHLFPKPVVRILSSSASDTKDANPSRDTGSSAGAGGAHVPTITLTQEDTSAGGIVVLGSPEIMEAQNHVKLLSFLLLIICSMELLALVSILLNPNTGPGADASSGGGENPLVLDDDILPSPSSQEEAELRTWRNSDFFDLGLSIVGILVARLGLQATAENTRALAVRYLVGTFVVGILWNAYYFYMNFTLEKEAELEHQQSDPDYQLSTTKQYAVEAFMAILIPSMVWCLCCFRAFQFHGLIRDAELDSQGRLRRLQQQQQYDDDDHQEQTDLEAAAAAADDDDEEDETHALT